MQNYSLKTQNIRYFFEPEVKKEEVEYCVKGQTNA